MFHLIDEAKLSDVPNVPDPVPVAPVASTEGLDTALPVKNGDIELSNRMQNPDNITYTINTLPSGNGKMISFYMNVLNLMPQAINQFVMLSDVLATENDAILIHFNSSLYCDEAETIHAAISSCKAKAKIASAPYTLNTAGFFPVLACTHILASPYVFAHFDTPSIRGGGNFKDAENGFSFDKNRKLRLVRMIHEEGFIPDDAFEKITERQGSYTLYGQTYINAINQFNKRIAAQ